MATNPRRKSRIAALQALYEADVSHHDPRASLTRLCAEEGLNEAQRRFASELLEGVIEAA